MNCVSEQALQARRGRFIALVNCGPDACLVQALRKTEPTDAAPDDGDLKIMPAHVFFLSVF
jgi:hypothetical protein